MAVDVPHDVILHLTDLTEALGEPGTDLQAMLEVLADDLTSAVPSFLGLSMIVTREGPGDGVNLNSLPAEQIGIVSATLMVPLDLLGVSGPGGRVIFYAGRPGAFVDLAADTRFAYGLDGQVALDQHLPTPGSPISPAGVSAPKDSAIINRAIGALISRGHTPEEAHLRLHDHAGQRGGTLRGAAEHFLDSPCGPGTSEQHPDRPGGPNGL